MAKVRRQDDQRIVKLRQHIDKLQQQESIPVPSLFTLEYYGFEPDDEWTDENREEMLDRFVESEYVEHWKEHGFCEMNVDGSGWIYPATNGIFCEERGY